MAANSEVPLPRRRRIGIVGYGSVGRFLVRALLGGGGAATELELVFVWNRTREALADVPAALVLEDLDQWSTRDADVVVEVAHPSITRAYGEQFLQRAHYFVGSPTALADADVEARLRAAAARGPHGVYVPVGALWGARDLERLAASGGLTALTVTMKKAPHHFRLTPPLSTALAAVDPTTPGETVLYEGPVRALCPLAPNNVNTMAAAALVAPSLGFDGVVARLVTDPSLEQHVIEVDARGANGFRVVTTRANPAVRGAVTGQATYGVFLASLLAAGTQGPGVWVC